MFIGGLNFVCTLIYFYSKGRDERGRVRGNRIGNSSGPRLVHTKGGRQEGKTRGTGQIGLFMSTVSVSEGHVSSHVRSGKVQKKGIRIKCLEYLLLSRNPGSRTLQL